MNGLRFGPVWSVFLVFCLQNPGQLAAQDNRIRDFMKAAREGDLETVDAAIKAGIDVNATVSEGWTALHAAAERARADVLKRLIEAGANVNAKEHLGVTPLHWAASRGPRESVRALIAAKADVNAWCVQMDTPLCSAASPGNVEILEELIKAGADVNGGKALKPLVHAVRYGHVEAIKILVTHGALINDPKEPPIHWARKPETAKALLAMGAKVDLRNSDGETSLHLPYFHWAPSAETVKVFIDAGADINARSKSGETPLHKALRHKLLPIVKLLVSSKADLDAKDSKGNTALALAEKSGPDFVAELTKSGAKDDGKSPVQRAVEKGDLDEVRKLLVAGSSPDSTCPGGKTVVHVASEKGHDVILAALLSAGAKVDARDEQKLRPLHYAITAKVADRLIAAGADVNEAKGDMQWSTPLHTAVMEGRPDVVKTLIHHKAKTSQDLLSWAAFAGRLEVVRALIECGLDPAAKGGLPFEPSALHVACAGGLADMESPKHVTREVRFKIAQLLIEKGADVNRRKQEGYFRDISPLMAASGSGAEEIVRLLLDKGAEINAASTEGMFIGATALHLAAERGHKDVVRLLLQRKAAVNGLTGKEHFKGVKSPLDLAEDAEVRKILSEAGGKKASDLTSGK